MSTAGAGRGEGRGKCAAPPPPTPHSYTSAPGDPAPHPQALGRWEDPLQARADWGQFSSAQRQDWMLHKGGGQ